jgi:cytochrome c-type biogenesis protein CcmH
MRSAMLKRSLQAGLLFVTSLVFLGAGDTSARFNDLGHRMMCVCGCHQILLECNHVGCQYSTRMRDELTAAVEREGSDDLALQWFVQTYGTIVIAAPSAKGFDRIAWIMPYLVLVFGLSTVVLIVRAWKGRPLIRPAGSVEPIQGAALDHFRERARKDTEE